MTDADVTAVVLAGGRSRRFGRDKLVEPIDGRPLLAHAIDAVRPLVSEIVVVTAPDGRPDVPSGVRVVHDPVAFEGPLVGARAGIAAASSPVVLLVAGDMPDLVPAVLASMVAALREADDAVVLEQEDGPRPLPMVVRRDPALVALDRLIGGGERRLLALPDALAAKVIAQSTWRALDPDGATTRDIDTEGDLA
ncbi:MAG: molybdenum cofactor guanylyltransferase [Chloroflexota bacterium]